MVKCRVEDAIVRSDIESVMCATKAGGQALPESVRNFFEPRFDVDFSHVRVHSGQRAAETAKTVNAKAFTIGREIVFGARQYKPESSEGRSLLAHELVHTIQQGSAGDARMHLQRTIGDGHDLTSPRFERDPVLEAVFDNERLLSVGSRGEAVAKVQQALVDLNIPLPRYGADGIFGGETKSGVIEYQRSRGLLADGVVGPNTMLSLDREIQLLSPLPQAQGIPPGVAIPPELKVMPKAVMKRMMADANTASNNLVWDAVGKLNDMRNEVEKNGRYPTETEPTWRAYKGVEKYLYGYQVATGFPSDISVFVRDVDKAVMYMIRNANFPAVPVEDIVEPTIACIPGKYALAYVNAPNAYAPDIYYCYPFFFMAGPQCRGSVTTHERFHLVGLHDGEEIPKENIGKAEFNAHNMNELVKFVMHKPATLCPGM